MEKEIDMQKTGAELETGDVIVRNGEEVTVAFVTETDPYVREVEVDGHPRLASFTAGFDEVFEVVA